MKTKIVLALALVLTFFAITVERANGQVPDNTWSAPKHYGFYIICPGTNPETYCEVAVYYQVKRNADPITHQYISGDLKIIDFDYAEDCPCVSYLEKGIVKTLIEAENAFFEPVRTPGNDITINLINITLESPCVRKYYYYKPNNQLRKFYRFINCGTNGTCYNTYTATFHQPAGNPNPAFAELTGISLTSDPQPNNCTFPCVNWCGNFALSGWDWQIPDVEPSNSDRYTGNVTPDDSYPPKISVYTSVSDLLITPNPAKELIDISFNSAIKGNSEIKLIDISGAIQSVSPCNVSLGANSRTIDISSLPSGTYTVIVTLEGEIIVSEKVIIKR